MADVGDVFTDLASVANDALQDLLPASGHEVEIHNIYHAGKIEVYRYDGTNDCLITTKTGAGVIDWLIFHCTNTDRIRVKNKSGGALIMGYDGIYTKVT